MSSRFARTIDALLLAAPTAAMLRWSDWATNMSRCIEMSTAGADVLRRNGIDARPVVCTLVACRVDANNAAEAVCFVGHTPESAYRFAQEQMRGPLSPFEEFKAGLTGNWSKGGGVHAVIEAKDASHRRHAFIDLTLGQVELTTQGAIRVPRQHAFYGKELPRIAFDELRTELRYGPGVSPLPVYSMTGLAGDIADILKLALRCDNDRDRFARAAVASIRPC